MATQRDFNKFYAVEWISATFSTHTTLIQDEVCRANYSTTANSHYN